MCGFLKKLVEGLNGKELNVDERNLLSVAYKNRVGARRSAWRALAAEEPKNPELVKNYKEIVEKELEDACKEVLQLISEFLVPSSKNNGEVESQVFYLKM